MYRQRMRDIQEARTKREELEALRKAKGTIEKPGSSVDSEGVELKFPGGWKPSNVLSWTTIDLDRLDIMFETDPSTLYPIKGQIVLISLTGFLRLIFQRYMSREEMKNILFWGVPSNTLTSEQIEELTALFNKWDRNDDGKISSDELKLQALEHLGDVVTPTEFDRLWEKHRKYCDDPKVVTKQEYLSFYRELWPSKHVPVGFSKGS